MWFSASDYAELLGLYQGDGHIVRTARTYRSRIFLDSSYPEIISDARDLLDRCFADNNVGISRSSKGTTTIVSVYSSHLPCLFPQHGPGRKHDRPIVLEEWQRTLVEAAPLNFLRGLIFSDGCRFINRTGRYRYPSFAFTNYSRDIADLFAASCDLVGTRYRRYGTRRVAFRVGRRESVDVLERAVGPKE